MSECYIITLNILEWHYVYDQCSGHVTTMPCFRNHLRVFSPACGSHGQYESRYRLELKRAVCHMIVVWCSAMSLSLCLLAYQYLFPECLQSAFCLSPDCPDCKSAVCPLSDLHTCSWLCTLFLTWLRVCHLPNFCPCIGTSCFLQASFQPWLGSLPSKQA